ncbi:DinB family protein [Stieleria varia]|uniref:DinB superfamily protein n=1 Tax=Stieleria varia TaxID=2528005 RepID=A0A5C5ZZ83_9BACT|nr:DinB family protein [Stieleria varia]TWT92357.1 DinB superfamily protein [Stieleria varia]
MNAQTTIEQTYGFSQMVLKSYIGDLTDAELLHRPGEGCNHIAWQLGHLISSECSLLDSVAPGNSIELPDGFAEKHSKENAGSDDPADFATKDEYLALFEKLQAASLGALASLSDEDLEKPAPEFLQSMCPNVGAVFVLISTHVMMHVGQFVPVRRKLGKPVVI